MILIENAQIMGLEPTIRGMRNPMNSWAKSDSGLCNHDGESTVECNNCVFNCLGSDFYVARVCPHDFMVGKADLDLMLRLARAGSVDGKFRRMIAVYVDITAPLYWWKEFDTYKVGTVANSCSTMHKIHAKEFTLDDFSHEHLRGEGIVPDHDYQNGHDILCLTIDCLNYWREQYLELSKIDDTVWKAAPKSKGLTDESLATAKKECWWQMIQLLPSSYNQRRTVMLNYEVLSNIYQHRRNHKLNEWRELCKWIEGLPYSEVITCNAAKQEEDSSIVAAITKLKNEQWSTEDIVALLLGQTKKEYMKLFSDDTDKMPVHGGAFEIPAVMADNTKND